MNTQEEARELAARQRRHDEHLRQTELMRSTDEIKTASGKALEEEARKTMRQHRSREDQIQEKVLRRSAAEVGLPDQTDNP
ncbi:MAG: hypothetical protein ACFB4I_03640 [Cyanophyceae cyanobacterium]